MSDVIFRRKGMKKRLRLAFQQITYLMFELSLIENRKYWRWIILFSRSSAWVILSYRIDRFFYLLLGQSWAFIRIILAPFFLFMRVLGAHHEINYRAKIGKGLRVLHGSLGIVISGNAVIGENFTLLGGNCIGLIKNGDIKIGNNVILGPNAVILGPADIGDRVQISAGVVVTDSVPDDEILIGERPHHIKKDIIANSKINSI
jgi:serine acetyltransferase